MAAARHGARRDHVISGSNTADRCRTHWHEASAHQWHHSDLTGVDGSAILCWCVLAAPGAAACHINRTTPARRKPTGSASEVLFFALAYIVMPASEYGSVTGAIQGTYLTVHILAAVAGDALLHTRAMNLTGLVWLSSIGVALAILCGAVFFPSQVSLWLAPARGRQGSPIAVEEPRAPVQAPQPRLRSPARIAGDFLVCRTAWLECCVSRRRLYGQTTPPSPASGEESLAQRAGFIWRLLRRVYSDAAFVLVALWWCLVGDPVYQNVYNFESSLYDALLPGAKAGASSAKFATASMQST